MCLDSKSWKQTTGPISTNVECSLVFSGNTFETRKTTGTAENPARHQTTLCDIQINVKYHWETYLQHSPLVPLTI